MKREKGALPFVDHGVCYRQLEAACFIRYDI